MEYKRYVQRHSLFLDFPKPNHEEDFMIVFDVSSLEKDELVIEFLEENKLKIILNHGFRNSGNFSFSRDCTYVYSLPENIQSTNLVAYWSGDDFLVIKEENSEPVSNESNSESDPDEKESTLDEIPNSPTVNYNEEKIMTETIPSNESKESEENGIEEKKSTKSRNGQEISNQEVVSIKADSGEKITLKEISTYVSNTNTETTLQVKGTLDESNENEEKIIQEKKSFASSEYERIVMQEKKFVHGSEVNTEKSMEKVDALDTEKAKSRLYPKRVPNLLNHMLSVNDLQDVMNDIEKRMKFVNEFIDKHR